ncbi:hypothetical protein BH20ACI4_BH20ACI4_23210 [soil metagenome]
MKNIFLVCILILFGFQNISAQSVAFTNVNVVPMDKERVLQNQTVLIKDGIIAEIGKKIKIRKDAQIIDGKGKYLIPGLMDMHTHLPSDGDDYPDSKSFDVFWHFSKGRNNRKRKPRRSDSAERESARKYFRDRKSRGRDAQGKILRASRIRQMARRDRTAHRGFTYREKTIKL